MEFQALQYQWCSMIYQRNTYYCTMITTIILLLSVIAVLLQIRSQQKWNRRRATQDIVDQLMSGEALRIKERLHPSANTYDSAQSYETTVATFELSKKQDFDFWLRHYLDYLEGIALGIRHKILDETIAYENLGVHLPAWNRWSKHYIDEQIKLSNDKTVYIELRLLAEKWNKKNECNAVKTGT